MSGCCETPSFDGSSVQYKRALIAVIAINAIMFCVEMTAGLAADSQALKADALDFASDTFTYALSFLVIGSSIRTRAYASLFKAFSLGVVAVLVLAWTVVRFIEGSAPEAQTMGIIGSIALLANLASVFLLLRWRDGDSNVRSVWLCSRNDAIGNVAVIGAAAMVASTGSALPDLAVGAILATLFLRSSFEIMNRARSEIRSEAANHLSGHEA